MNTKKTGSSEPTFASVWETLSKVDCNEHKQSKNGLSYLSWAWAWGILMEHYPQATYDFLKEERDEFGHVEVWCKVCIGELERLMWLPVMDYKNNAIKNPDLRKVSDTRMRCLTKCISMFGLGHYIYAGEDLPADVEQEPEAKPAKPAKAEKPKAPPAPDKSKPAPIPGSKLSDDIPTEEEAAGVVEFLKGSANEFASGSMQDLVEFWQINKQVIDVLDTKYPAQYKNLQSHFAEIKQKLQQEAVA
jgi:hypothetical protein